MIKVPQFKGINYNRSLMQITNAKTEKKCENCNDALFSNTFHTW